MIWTNHAKTTSNHRLQKQAIAKTGTHTTNYVLSFLNISSQKFTCHRESTQGREPPTFQTSKKHPPAKLINVEPKVIQVDGSDDFPDFGIGLDFLLVPAVKIFRSVLFHVVQESTMTHSTSPSKGFCDASILTKSSDESNDTTNSGWVMITQIDKTM